MNTNKLIEENLLLAKKIAFDKKKSLPNFVDLDDLQSAAYLGLVEAANRFDETRGIAFSTFAYPRIFGSVLDFLRQNFKFDKSNLDGEDVNFEFEAPAKEDESELFDHIFKDFDKYDQDILRSYFVIGTSMKEIGNRYGVSESRISQLISRNKKRVKDKWDYQDLTYFLSA